MSAYPRPVNNLIFNGTSQGSLSVKGDQPISREVFDNTSSVVSKSVMVVRDTVSGNFTELEGENGNLIISSGVTAMISTDNSTTQLLPASTTYAGVYEDVLTYSSISILASGDNLSTLWADFSIDGITAVRQIQLSDLVADNGVHTLIVVAKYFRIRLINDIVDNNISIQTIYNINPRVTNPTSRLTQVIDDFTDVINVRSVLSGKNPDGVYNNIASNYLNNLVVEAHVKPIWDGVSFKGTNSDGTVGIVVDGRRYRAQELVQEVDEIFLTNSSAVPLLGAGEFIKIMSEPEAPQIVSSSIADSYALNTGATQVLLQGWVIDPITYEWSIGVDLYNTNGQTPASGLFGTLFIRVIAGQAVLNGADIDYNSFDNACYGTMYFISAGEPITLGIPDTLNNSCFAVSRAGACVFYTGYVTAPPSHQTMFSEHILGAISSGQTVNIKASYYARTVETGVIYGQPNTYSQNVAWKRAALLTLLSNNGSISAHQSSFPDLSGSVTGDQITELTVLLTRVDGNTSAILSFSNLTGNTIADSAYGV